MTKSPPYQVRRGLHAAQVRAGLRLGHRQALDALAAHRRQQVTLALLAAAGQQDVGGARHAEVLQRVAGVAEFLLVQHPAHRIETGAADLARHVGRVQPGGDGLVLELLQQIGAHCARVLDLALVRHQLLAHEARAWCG